MASAAQVATADWRFPEDAQRCDRAQHERWGRVSGLEQEARLVERCLKGEEAAWEELARTYTKRVYSVCYRFTGNEALAEELTQEVFLRVYRNLRSFRSGQGTFSTWLMRLTRNLLVDHYRRSRIDRLTDSLEEQLPSVELRTRTESGPDGVVMGREANELLRAALQKLSPDLRETVILRDLEGLEYREIAEVLGIPEGTVKSRLNRGRADLARILRKHGAVA